ncbi:PAS domain-containing protein [Sphingomonas sp. ID1715]|uniref:PAS domain-containing protein n=1 Tax=Sphingomonas sp. ID1715 TaxID=1656898 RepID=UPI001489A86D|nr:PAS domain-containing protein [Sphingomonas sp. ID1715]NNM76580.1 PAS domain-containing protein [Sphingomonas sp. ID1715]
MFSVVHIIQEAEGLRAQTSYYLSKQGYSPRPYSTVTEFLDTVPAAPGCVLLGAGPELSDLGEQIATIGARSPRSPVIILSHSLPAPLAFAAVKAGAIDCVEAPCGADLIVALEKARLGHADSRENLALRQVALARLARLSQRERQVLQGLVGGMTNKQIARRLELSPRTVEMHSAHMLSQLEARNSAAAVRLATTAGIPPLCDADQIGASALAPAYSPNQSARQRRTRQGTPFEATLPSVIDVLEGTTDCVFLLDRDERFTYFNRAAIEAIADQRDLTGLNLWDAFPAARQTIAFAQMREAARERRPVRFEFYEPDLAKWFDVSVRPIPSGLQVFFRDLTQTRMALIALRQSEERLRLALEASGDGAWDFDVSSGRIEMSPGYLRNLGYDHRAVPSTFEWVKSRIHPEDLPGLERLLAQHLLGTSDPYCAEYRVLDGQDQWRWNLDRGRVVDRDAETGEARRMVGTGTDITELKLQRLRAEEAFERLNLAQAGAGAGLWDYDLAERTLRLCARSLSMHGIAAAPFVPVSERRWEDSVNPEDLPAARKALEDAIATGGMFRASYRTRGDADPRWILGLGRIVPPSCGQPRRFVGINLQLSAMP